MLCRILYKMLYEVLYIRYSISLVLLRECIKQHQGGIPATLQPRGPPAYRTRAKCNILPPPPGGPCRPGRAGTARGAGPGQPGGRGVMSSYVLGSPGVLACSSPSFR